MKTGVKEPGPGETRLCRDPWLAPAVRADGGVMRCCYGGVDFGRIGSGPSLSDLFMSDSARLARRQLLTGNLDAMCRICPRFPVVTVEEYRKHIDWMLGHFQTTGEIVDDLTDAVVPEMVWLELTSRCNLRCIYCHQATREFVHHELPLKTIDSVVDALIGLGVPQVSLTGRGENTVIAGWEVHAERLLDAGVKVMIITNLARPITEHEARTFARMKEVCLSIDTVDRTMFKQLRTGDVRIALENVAKILAANQRLRNPDFTMRWSAVVTAATAPGLLDVAAMAVALGVSRVEFHCLIGIDGILPDRRPATLDEMDPVTVAGIGAAVQAAEKFLIDRLGPQGVFVAPGLRSAWEAEAES